MQGPDATKNLLRAAFQGNASEVKELLRAGLDPNSVSEDTGSTALIRATARSHLEVVRELLNARAFVHPENLQNKGVRGSPVWIAQEKFPGSELCQLLEEAAKSERIEVLANKCNGYDELPPHLQIIAVAYDSKVHADGERGQTEGHKLSEQDLSAARDCASSLLYGEMLPDSVTQLWQALGLQKYSEGTLLELGMGTGKIALQAFVEHPQLQRVFGIELASSRYLIGEAALLRLAEAMPERFQVIECEPGRRIVLEDNSTTVPRVLEFQQGDMLKVGQSEMAAADVVLMEVCMPTSLHSAVCAKTRELKIGAKLFCFANLCLIWPANLDGPPCQLRPCRGEDGSAFDRGYATSWSDDSEHQFFLMEVCSAEAAAASQRDMIELRKDGEGLLRARTSTNPSNLQIGEDEECEGFIVKFRGPSIDVATLAKGQCVEVAPRVHLIDKPPTWNKAWILQVYMDLPAVDVFFAKGGDIEEKCDPCRIRALPDGMGAPTENA
eukprot:TRINITY_DN14272_c3_g1_i1.p1 TRINITY_DN14272_c3_g1~~TRINITY_DN14272_c3_g1_i1.p1  ORF type:complete len:497 (+),score=91.54 TRINITY_DN14272_c3_g1_i1:37-1527(+)